MPILARDDGPDLAYDFDRGDVLPDVCVVFCHGFASVRNGEKSAVFREHARRAGWSFLTFDARGHGESGGAMNTFTFSGYLADLAAMLDGPAAGASRLVLVGSSLGGAAVLYAACRRPARIAAVCAIAPGLGFARRFCDVLPLAERLRWQETGRRVVNNAWIGVELGWEFVVDGARYDEDEPTGITAPLLLIHGSKDEVVPAEVSQRFAANFRGKTLDFRSIDGGDHRLAADKETLAEWVDDWVRRFALPAP